MTITVITKPGCGWCSEVKKLLTREGLAFEERELNDPATRADFADRHRITTFPQVFVTSPDGKGERRIGGYEDTLAWLHNTRMEQWLAEQEQLEL